MNPRIDETKVFKSTSNLNTVSRRAFMRLFTAAVAVAAGGRRRAGAQEADPGGSFVQQGRKYHDGDGVVVDYKKAAQLFKSASDVGSADGQAWLGMMHLRGRGVAQDDAKAAELINASAEAGSPAGLRFSGVLHQEGRTVPQDYGKAKEFYERAASKGDAVAFGRLGMLHLFGRGVPANVGKAREYLGMGASGGDPWSKVELGMLYLRDHNKSDRAFAFEQFAQAAEQGNRVGAYRLACAHHFGIGTAKDPVATLKFVKQSAAKGYPVAQAALGSLYEKGNMVEKDLQRAYAFYTLASRQGDKRAASHLRFLARQMTVQEIQNANALADGYRAKNLQSKGL